MAKLNYPSDSIQTRPLLDPGEYHVRVNEVNIVEGTDGKRDRMTLNMVVASGEQTGFPLFAGFSLPTEADADTICEWERGLGDKARNMQGFLLDLIQQAAKAFGVPWTKTGFDPDDFQGKEAYCTVSHREYQGELQMDVKGWKVKE